MNAREQLRRYLEQRRELGEEELVLDRLEVDDVLRLVGALRGGQESSPGSSPTAGSGRPQEAADAGAGRGPAPAVAPGGTAPAARPEGAPAGEARVVREATEQYVDWRAALRAAGGGPPSAIASPRTDAGAAHAAQGGEMARGGGKEQGAGRPAAGEPAAGAEGHAAASAAAPRKARSTRAPAAAAAGAGATAAALPEWATGLGIPAGLSVGTAGALDATFAGLATLDAVARTVAGCTRCPLYRTATHAVPGEGNPAAELVCVGEAPGANEDATGRPFVGQAGQLLTKILAAIKLSREDVFICNVLKHRPPGNRNPEPTEVEACSPYLLRQLELVKPKVILTLGTFAAQTLLGTKTPIGKLRGQVHLYHGIPLVVTYHPAALLRNSAWKRPTWEDVQLARRLLDSAPRARA